MSNGDDLPPNLNQHAYHLDPTQAPEFANAIQDLFGAFLSAPASEELDGDDLEDMPPLEPLNVHNAPTFAGGTPMAPLMPVPEPALHAQTDNNHISHDHDDEESMPDLQSVSDSSEDDVDMFGVMDDDGDDAWEDVDAGIGEDDGPPPLEPISLPHRSSERRARAEDAEDEDEDGRPTRRQRVSGQRSGSEPSTFLPNAPPPAAEAASRHHRPLSFIGNPTQFLNSLPRMFNPGNVGLNTHNHAHHRPPQPPSVPGPQVDGPAHPHPHPSGGFGIAVAFDAAGNAISSFPLGAGAFPPGFGMPTGVGHGPHGPAQPPHEGNGGIPVGDDTLNDFVRMISGLVAMGPRREEEKDDPERAKKLVAGLEIVPVGLVRRMEQVGDAGGVHANAAGGTGMDAPGCAICWDALLDTEGGGFEVPGSEATHTSADPREAPTSTQAEVSAPPSRTSEEALTTAERVSSGAGTEKSYPQIIALPCSHVFHASCLVPWFSRPRHMTCPTCRFDIDPDNLTYNPPQRVFNTPVPPAGAQAAAATAPSTANAAQDAPRHRPSVRGNAARPLPAAFRFEPNAQGAAADLNGADGPQQTQGPPGVGFTLDISFMVEPFSVPGEQRPAAPPNMPHGFNGPPGFGFSLGSISPAEFTAILQRMSGAPAQGAAAGAPRAETGAGAGDAGVGAADAGASADAPPLPTFFGPPPPPPMQANVRPAEARPLGAPPAGAGETFGPFLMGGMFPIGGPGRPRQPMGTQPQPPREWRQWTPPPAPGPTVRQRVEKRERELGLRCWSTSCDVGPSDEEPFPKVSPAALKQVTVRRSPTQEDADAAHGRVCEHAFHPACLVMAERIAGWNGEARDGTRVPVACPVCRAPGYIEKEEWTDGVAALA